MEEDDRRERKKYNVLSNKVNESVRQLIQGVVFDSEVLRACMRDNLGDCTFLEAYNKTRRVLNISVSSSTMFEMPRMLNYLTAPNVVISNGIRHNNQVKTKTLNVI